VRAPLDLGGLEIPLAVAILVGGTATFVVLLTVAAQVVDWLLGPQDRRAETGRRNGGGARSASGRPASRIPSSLLPVVAAGLGLALTWSVVILLRLRSLA